MSSFFVFDHHECPALPLHSGSDGHPDKLIYWEDLTSTGGPMKIDAKFTGRNICRIPDDDGASWTVADLGGTTENARGAYLYLEVVGEVDMIVVNQRFQRALANRQRVVDGVGGSEESVQITESTEEQFDPADANKDHVVTKKERKQYENQ